MLGVLGGTGAYLTIRCIGHRASALHSMLYFSYYSCFVSLILAALFPSQRFILPHSTRFVIALFAVCHILFHALRFMDTNNHLCRLAFWASWRKRF